VPPGTIPRLLKYPATAYGVDYGGVCVCVCVLDVKREGGGSVRWM